MGFWLSVEHWCNRQDLWKCISYPFLLKTINTFLSELKAEIAFQATIILNDPSLTSDTLGQSRIVWILSKSDPSCNRLWGMTLASFTRKVCDKINYSVFCPFDYHQQSMCCLRCNNKLTKQKESNVCFAPEIFTRAAEVWSFWNKNLTHLRW